MKSHLVKSLVAFAVVATAETNAHAQEQVTLAWSAPKECPTAAEVIAKTKEKIPATAQIRAKGRVEKSGGRYRLVLEIESRGERAIEAVSCAEIAASASVILAMSVSPPEKEKEEKEPEKEEPPPPKPAVRVEPPQAREQPIPKPPPPSEDTIVDVRLHGAIDKGTLPSVGAGGGLALGYDPLDKLHLELAGNLWAAQDGSLAADGTRGASFGLVTLGARGCWALVGSARKATVSLSPCLGAEIVVLSASGFGANRPSDATSVSWAPEASFQFGVPLGNRFSIRAGLGATAPTSRQAFVIARQGEEGSAIHRSDPIVIRGWLGPEVHF